MDNSDFGRGLLIGNLVGIILGLLYAHSWRMSVMRVPQNREGSEGGLDVHDAAVE